MKKTLLFLLLLSTWWQTKAQYSDSTHYRVMVSATGSLNKTNESSAYLLNNSLNLGMKKKSFDFNSSSTWLYGKQDSALSNNDFSTTLNFNLYKTLPHFYYWGLLNYNTSYSLKINNQLLAGLGVAYSVLDKTNAYLNLSDGILFDKSNLLADLNYHTWRNSFRLQYHFAIKELITLDGSNFLQSSLSNPDDYIFRSVTTVGFKLRKWISLSTSATYNKMNITKSENMILTYGLVIDKYF